MIAFSAGLELFIVATLAMLWLVCFRNVWAEGGLRTPDTEALMIINAFAFGFWAVFATIRFFGC